MIRDRERPLYMISVAAELAGMHPQTLRVYEAKGLVAPKRSAGNTRLYSQADVDRLRLIAELTDEGINLTGVIRILDMQKRLELREQEFLRLQRRLRKVQDRLREYERRHQVTALVRVDRRAIQRFMGS